MKVWFQNRRMKDKRQRFIFPWTYPGLYADPNFAASILQATVGPFGMPYGFGPNSMMPQMTPVFVTPQIALPSLIDPMFTNRYSPYSTSTHAPPLGPNMNNEFIFAERMTKLKGQNNNNSKLFRPYALSTSIPV